MRISLIAVVLGTCVAGSSFADTIVASGAGNTLASAEDLTAYHPTEIIGTLDGTNQNDASFFEFQILAPLAFSAMTVDTGAFGIPDTVLSLFDSSGAGVMLNDDITPTDTLSCLPAAGAGNPCPSSRGGLGPLLPGVYYLAISRGANYPLDTGNNEIFNPVNSTDVVGPSTSAAAASWDGGAYTSPDFDLVNYDILLTGTTPEPGTVATVGAGLGLLLALRRKRKK